MLIYTAGLGVTGAAIASAVSYTVFGALMFIAYRKKEKSHWRWNNFSANIHLLKECADIGVPVLGTSLASCMGIRILFTFLCVIVWKLDLRAVRYCMIADNVCKALLFALPAKKYVFFEAVEKK